MKINNYPANNYLLTSKNKQKTSFKANEKLENLKEKFDTKSASAYGLFTGAFSVVSSIIKRRDEIKDKLKYYTQFTPSYLKEKLTSDVLKDRKKFVKFLKENGELKPLKQMAKTAGIDAIASIGAGFGLYLLIDEMVKRKKKENL